MREIYSRHLAIIVGIFVFIATVIFALLQTSDMLLEREWEREDMPHPVEGYEECNSCHGLDAEFPYPQNHQGWSIQSCTQCHMPSDENTAAFQKSPDHGILFPIIDNNRLESQERDVQSAYFLGTVDEFGEVRDAAGTILGSVYGHGNVEDAEGRYRGRIDPWMNVRDASDRIIGSMHNRVARDRFGRTIGRIEPNGDVRDRSGRLIGRVDGAREDYAAAFFFFFW
jgi:hypothetical protein